MWKTLRRVIGTGVIAAVVLGGAFLIGAYVDVEQRAVHAIIDPQPAAVYADRKSPPSPRSKTTADKNGRRQTAHAMPAAPSAAATRTTTVGSGVALAAAAAVQDTADDDQQNARLAKHHGRSRHARRLAARREREPQEPRDAQELSTQARSAAPPPPSDRGLGGFFFPFR